MSRIFSSPFLKRIGQKRNYCLIGAHNDVGASPAKMMQQQQDVKNSAGVEDDNGSHVEELDDSVFQLKMRVAKAFYGGINAQKQKIEKETEAKIFVPPKGNTNNLEPIIIKAKTRSNVLAGQEKITLLLPSLRKRLRPTHFYCVALNYGEIRENFNEFKKQLVAANLPDIDETLFIADGCIHLTFGTCVLLDDAERTKAGELLQQCREFLTDLQAPFDIKVSGLSTFSNDNPKSVRVLYASVVAPVLQEFANRTFQHFVQSGLCCDDHGRDDVKLHMTLLNNRYRKAKNNKRPPKGFDAREIMKRFGDFHFGSTQSNEMHLCVLGSGGKGQEFYKITDTVICGDANITEKSAQDDLEDINNMDVLNSVNTMSDIAKDEITISDELKCENIELNSLKNEDTTNDLKDSVNDTSESLKTEETMESTRAVASTLKSEDITTESWKCKESTADTLKSDATESKNLKSVNIGGTSSSMPSISEAMNYEEKNCCNLKDEDIKSHKLKCDDTASDMLKPKKDRTTGI